MSLQLAFYNQSMASGSKPSSKNTTLRALSYWKENNMQLPSNESERRGDTKCDMSPNSIERDFNFRATSVSINDVSDLWTELEAQYFSPPRSKIVNMSTSKKISKYSANSLRNRNIRNRRPRNHRRIRHILEGFPDPPSSGASSLQRNVDRNYRIKGASVLSTDSDDILNQRNSLLIQSSESKNVCVKLFESNPMDFEYFDKVVRSEDEAQQQLEWKRKRRMIHTSGKGWERRYNPQRSNKDSYPHCQKLGDSDLCLEKSKSPFHEEIISVSVSEYQLSTTILNLLQSMYTKSVRHQLNSVFLSSSRNKLFDFLTQFCADNLMMLSHNKHNENFTKDEMREIRVLLIKLMMSSQLNVVFDPDYIIHLQNNHTIHLSLVALREVCKGAEAKIKNSQKDLSEADIVLEEVIQLNVLVLQVIRMFHVAGEKMHRRPSVCISYMVCDWFCMENGAGVMEACLSLILGHIQQNPEKLKAQPLTYSVTLFLSEIGKFLSTVGVCELSLTNTKCTKRTINVLAGMYMSLFKYLFEFANVEVTQVSEGHSVVLAILDCLLLDIIKTPACINPRVIWEELLNVILMFDCKPEGDIIRKKVYFLLETYISHYFGNHFDALIPETIHCAVTNSRQGSSLTDSDSAFYDPTPAGDASDTSMEDKIVGAKQEILEIGYTYLEKYRLCLLTTNQNVIKQTVQHIKKFVHACPPKLRIHVLRNVIIPTLAELSSLGMVPLTEIQTYLAQKLFCLIERMVYKDERLGYCCARNKLVKIILKFSEIKGDDNDYFFADDAFQCASSFVRTEVLQCLKGVSLDSLSFPFTDTRSISHVSSSEISREGEDGSPYHRDQHSRFYTSISSNDTVNEVLHSLVLETNNMIIGNNLEALTLLKLKQIGAMWKTQAAFVSEISEYASFFLETHVYAKLSHDLFQYLLKGLKMYSCKKDSSRFRKSIIATLGSLLRLLSKLSQAQTLSKSSSNIIETQNSKSKAALASIEENIFPNDGGATHLHETDIQGIVRVLLKAAVEPLNDRNVCLEHESSVETRKSFFVPTGGPNKSVSRCNSFPETDSGYTPDIDEDSDVNTRKLAQHSVSETGRRIENQIVNKDIVDFVLRMLVNKEGSTQALISIKGGKEILIDGISRLLDLSKGDENIENRYV